MKLPSFQFYPADWRKDPGVQALTFEERGIWIELLCLMHESSQRGKLLLNGKPILEDRLAQILHIDKQKISTTISTFLELGVASICEETGALINRRMVKDEELIQKRREAGRQSGGNPLFLKGKSNPYYNNKKDGKDRQTDKQTDKQKITTIDKQKITPSSSSSSSYIKDLKDLCSELPKMEVSEQEEIQKKVNQEEIFAIGLILNTGDEYPITKKLVEEFAAIYPSVDIMQALREMKGWCLTNDKKRKTKAGILKFVNSWLSREQDKGGNSRGQPIIKNREDAKEAAFKKFLGEG